MGNIEDKKNEDAETNMEKAGQEVKRMELYFTDKNI